MFVIMITTVEGILLRVDVEWIGGFGVHSQGGYIRSSMSALAELSLNSPSVLSLTVRPYLISYNSPLFRLDSIGCLLIEGERTITVMNALAKNPVQPLLLPKLQYLVFSKVELNDKELLWILKLLRFRKDLVVVLEPDHMIHIQYLMPLRNACVIEGGFVSLNVSSFFANRNLVQNVQHLCPLEESIPWYTSISRMTRKSPLGARLWLSLLPQMAR